MVGGVAHYDDPSKDSIQLEELAVRGFVDYFRKKCLFVEIIIVDRHQQYCTAILWLGYPTVWRFSIDFVWFEIWDALKSWTGCASFCPNMESWQSKAAPFIHISWTCGFSRRQLWPWRREVYCVSYSRHRGFFPAEQIVLGLHQWCCCWNDLGYCYCYRCCYRYRYQYHYCL